MEAVIWHSESCILYPYIFTCKCLLQRIIGLVRGPWFLLHHRCGAFTRVFLGYPVVALCCRYPSALGLQVRSLHVLQHVIKRIQAGADQNIILVLGQGAVELVHQPALPCLCHQSELFSIAPANSSLTVISKKWGGFSFHTLIVGSPTPIPLGPALLYSPGEIQVPLFKVLQLVRDRNSPPALKTPGPDPPPISSIDGWKVGERAPLLYPCYHVSDE